VLQRSIAIFRARTGFDREVTIWDMSLEHGGHYGPHRSHRSGRDVDIGLPLRAGFTLGTAKKGSVDWEATWHLIRAFIESGEVRYVFLSRQRQISLYKLRRHARGTGAHHPVSEHREGRYRAPFTGSHGPHPRALHVRTR
jgi:hypothetical protein